MYINVPKGKIKLDESNTHCSTCIKTDMFKMYYIMSVSFV